MHDLHQIIEDEDLETLRSALGDGADIAQAGHCGATPLIAVIRRKNEAMFELLLAHGADPEQTNDFNQTALHAAAEYDWPYAVARLIEIGVDLGRNLKYPLKPLNLLEQFNSGIGDIMAHMDALAMPEEIADLFDG